MDHIRFSISNPVKISVGVMLVILFGLIALFTIPIQLTPDVDQPVITVETNWVGRSPEEVEREIVEEQEDKLKAVTNLKKLTATAAEGRATVKLEFYVGTNLNRALQEVSDKLREVPQYPDDVDEPVVAAAEAASENAIAWMILDSTDPDFDIQSFYDVADKRIKPFLERVSGLSRINIYGGREREVHMQMDPRKLAQRGITFNDLRQALELENVNLSAGDLPEGRLDVRIRTVGQYDNLDDVRRTIVKYDSGGPVRIADLGEVELTLEKRRSFVRANGEPALAINAIRETGSNVIQVMEGLRARIDLVNEQILKPYENDQHGLRLRQVYDETVYIYDAINLVKNNLWLGGTFAVLVLLLFLGSQRAPWATVLAVPCLTAVAVTAILVPQGPIQLAVLALLGLAMLAVLLLSRKTAIVALAIPISVIGTFVAMTAFGRNLNVISLAGLAFAVGMVVDNAIVVLENIDRHLALGKTAPAAAYDATKEVWGAILASTLTTLAVFLPVLTIQEEAGQLFRDISLAICAAVALSLIVSITVIPSAASRWLRKRSAVPSSQPRFGASLFGLKPLLSGLTAAFADFIYWATAPTRTRFLLRLIVITLFTGGSILGAYLLKPPSSYLPNGNQNLVFGIMFNPPGYNLEQNQFIGDRIEKIVRPYWQAASTDQATAIAAVIDFATQQPYPRVPPIANYFFVSFQGTVFMGAASADPQLTKPLESVLSGAMMQIPGSFGFAQQASIFGRGLGGTNAVDVEISATDLNELRIAAQALYGKLIEQFGLMSIRPDPMNFNLTGPELQLKIDQVKAKDLGIDVAALGIGVRALVDGAKVGDYRLEGDSIDLLLTRSDSYPLPPDGLAMVPIAVHDSDGTMRTVPLGSVAQLVPSSAPQSINHIEQRRSITLSVIPSQRIPLEQATNQIADLIAPLRAQGQIAPNVEVSLAGTADKLTQVRESLLGAWHGWTFASLQSLITSRIFLALLVTYLLMAALFESFVYPFVIMFAVPLATIGGFLGLFIVHRFNPTQQLDTLTMLGFVILIGVVVNNAILVVHQALNFMRGLGEGEGDDTGALAPRHAIRASVRTRIRPIFMTTTTSVFGMLPLVLMPGSGSELYRGLGSVVIGGLVVASLFTLVVVPLLFSLALDVKQWLYQIMQWDMPELATAPALK
jgi:HAE1 family hydrophobic/amphiphilic exporter-1